MKAAGIAAIFLVAAACSGGNGPASDPTEQGALDTALAVGRAVLDGDAGPVIDAFSDECRDLVDVGDVSGTVEAVPTLLDAAGLSGDDINLTGDVTSFEAGRAVVALELHADARTAPLDVIGNGDRLEMVYADARWWLATCGLDGDGQRGDGMIGTRARPAALGEVVAVGDGFSAVVVESVADPLGTIAAGGGVADPAPGLEPLMYRVAVGYHDTPEPARPSQLSIEFVGGITDAIYPETGCGYIGDALGQYRRLLLSGGALDGLICFDVAPGDAAGGLLVVTHVSASEPIYFDPATGSAGGDELVAAIGPSEDGSLSAARATPIPLGERIELDEWAVTVHGSDRELDVADIDGRSVLLIDVTAEYIGGHDSLPVAYLSFGVGGDTNQIDPAGCDGVDPATIPNPFDASAELGPGGSVSGNLCFLIDAGPVDNLQLFVTDSPASAPTVAAL